MNALGVSVSELKSHRVGLHRIPLREVLFGLFFLVFAKVKMVIAKTHSVYCAPGTVLIAYIHVYFIVIYLW